MRIAITSDYIDIGNIGGAGRVLWELAGEFLRRGFQVSFLVGGPKAQHDWVEHPAGIIEWLSFPYRTGGKRGLRFLGDVRRDVREGLTRLSTPDVIVHNQPLTADALRQVEQPAIYVFHSPWPNEFVADRFGDDELPHGLSRGLGTRVHVGLRRRIERRAIRSADRFVTLSQHMRDRLESLYGIDPALSTVCPGGVDIDRFSPVADTDRARIRKRWGVQDHELALTCVRRLVPRTGVDQLVHALGELSSLDGLPPWRALIAGRGPETERISTIVRERRLDARVRMVGYVSDEELADLYRAADVTVVPTRALEGFGLSTLESLACGTPVIATPVGGTREILSAFDPEFLCGAVCARSLAERLQQWLGRAGGLRERRADCREFVFENYSWERMADGFVEVIEETMTPV